MPPTEVRVRRAGALAVAALALLVAVACSLPPAMIVLANVGSTDVRVTFAVAAPPDADGVKVVPFDGDVGALTRRSTAWKPLGVRVVPEEPVTVTLPAHTALWLATAHHILDLKPGGLFPVRSLVIETNEGATRFEGDAVPRAFAEVDETLALARFGDEANLGGPVKKPMSLGGWLCLAAVVAGLGSALAWTRRRKVDDLAER